MSAYTDDLYMGWDEFQAHCIRLAATLNASGKTFDALVAVTRGGLFPAGIIARELDIRMIDTFCVFRYKGQGTGSETILKTAANLEGKNVLVVDDLADKGRTLEIVREHIPHATIATVFVKPEGKPQVDHYVSEVAQSTWVRFPWDTYRAYKNPLVAEKA